MDPLRSDFEGTVSTEETNAKLEAILDAALDAIISTDSDGTIESFNRAAEQMFGFRAGEVIGCNISMFVPTHLTGSGEPCTQPCKATGERKIIGHRSELTARRRDGSEFPIELALSGVEVDGRHIFTAIIRDISRCWAVETELLEYREHLEQLVAERTAALENVQEALRGANANLRQLVRIDELTGIGNRRAFDERLAIEWRRQQRNRNPLSVLICDVDLFKRYNDYYGHPAGDVCLRKIALACDECFQRATEFAARYGGEEFAAVLSNTDMEAARERAEALRRKVRALTIEHDALGPGRFVTVSVGVASVLPDRSNGRSALVEAADSALYRAKRKGRNRVELAPPVRLPGSPRRLIPSRVA